MYCFCSCLANGYSYAQPTHFTHYQPHMGTHNGAQSFTNKTSNEEAYNETFSASNKEAIIHPKFNSKWKTNCNLLAILNAF